LLGKPKVDVFRKISRILLSPDAMIFPAILSP
jgi:hypothetical protein